MRALDYYEQALAIYREVGDQNREATTLNNISGVHHNRGDFAAALDYYEQALPIRREVGDRAGEATALNNIGAVHDSRGAAGGARPLRAGAAHSPEGRGSAWSGDRTEQYRRSAPPPRGLGGCARLLRAGTAHSPEGRGPGR